MSEGLTIEFTNAHSQRRRYRFERRSVGGWWRHEEQYSDGQWRPVGREVVTDVAIEETGDIVREVGRA